MFHDFPDSNSDPLAFYKWLKNSSEKFWQNISLNPKIYGFQIQPNTKWNKGLTDSEIQLYEKDLGIKFPLILKQFLQTMNGTCPESINIYGSSSEEPSYFPGYYSYPKDLEKVKDMIHWIMEENELTPKLIQEEEIPPIFPIESHRFLVIDASNNFPVLSMYGDDIILYANNLPSFLINDIFHNHRPDPDLDSDLKINFWH